MTTTVSILAADVDPGDLLHHLGRTIEVRQVAYRGDLVTIKHDHGAITTNLRDSVDLVDLVESDLF